MKKFLNKNVINTVIIFISFIIIISLSCVINDIKKIADDPDFKPKWDVDARLLVVDYSAKPISFESYVKGKALNSPEVPIPVVGGVWPVAENPAAIPGSMAVDTGIDVDSDTVIDFVLDGYYTPNSDVLKLQIWLTDGAGPALPISSDCINIEGITIEGATINFGSPTSQSNILVYTSTNFFDPADEYYLDLTGAGAADELDFFVDVELLNGSPPNYAGAGLTLHVKLAFDMGDDFGVIGTITNAGVLKSISNENIPINDLPMDSIKNFKLEFEYDSNLSFDLNINTTYYGSDNTPSPNTFNTTIDSGVLTTSAMHAYDYVSSSNKSTDDFSFNDNVLSYGDMRIDLSLVLPGASGRIRLNTDTFIRVKIIASAEATISL